MPKTNGIGATEPITMADLGPTQSLQLMFAKLQLELSQTSKASAMERMEKIKESQEEQKLVARLLNEARAAQAAAKNGATETKTVTYKVDGKTVNERIAKGDKTSFMSQDMVDYMDKNNLAYDKTSNDHIHNEEEWKLAITSLESRLEQVGTDTQQQMVYVQDFMGQYNSYLQGANTQISASNQTLTALARGQ